MKPTAEKIESIFATWKDADIFSGVISLSDKTGVIYEKVQDFRNRGEQLPNQVDTAFGIASGGKLFTAAAICQLIDQGKLSLDSKIGDILPQDLKNIDKNITVFQLLTHSSGIADYLEFDDDKAAERQFYIDHPVSQWTSNAFYLPFFNEKPSVFEPGSKMDYSNSNYILLALMIEAVSGEDYHRYITEHIIKPLDLTRTGFHATNNLPGNTAVGYTWDVNIEAYVGNNFLLPIIGAGDGGLYTTAGDMVKFWTGLFAGKLFSQEMLTQFLTPRVVFEDIDGHIGLGVFITEKDGETIYWHDGSDYGVGFHSAYCPATGKVLTILSNKGTALLDFAESLMPFVI
ncbi:MAG: beta-lactamase family protein [Defluviitaleaceae bacterium]|nr:beta-lactamase family protein [Defluviitaleaceae bacterium]